MTRPLARVWGAGLVLAVLASAAGPRARAADLWEAERSCPGSAWPWSGYSLFVNVPAHVASDPVTQTVGMALALTFVPADLVGQAIHGASPQQDRSIPRFAHAGLCGGVLLGKGVALAVGAPFWLLEEAFWVQPRRAFSRPPPPLTSPPPAP